MFETDKPWFIQTHFTVLEIISFNSNSKEGATKTIIINDANIIYYFVEGIQQIPSKGKIMISFSKEAERIELVFRGNNESEKIYVMEGRFKTPSTGFNIGDVRIETDLYKKITELLNAKVSK